MQNSKLLSVIIVNYRSEHYLERCIASVYNYLEKDIFEIIVVNNDICEDLKRTSSNFAEIKIINQQRNIGFGAADNKGAREAHGKYLLFLNPDTEILSAEAVKILDKFAENKKIAAIGPRLLTDKGKTQEWCAGKEFTLWELIKNNIGLVESKKIWESQKEIFADWVSGAALFIRKEIFESIGGFDENFFMYFEDEDLCKRIRRAGYNVVYFPQVSILHHGGKSRKSPLKQKKQYFASLFYFFWKRMRHHV